MIEFRAQRESNNLFHGHATRSLLATQLRLKAGARGIRVYTFSVKRNRTRLRNLVQNTSCFCSRTKTSRRALRSGCARVDVGHAAAVQSSSAQRCLLAARCERASLRRLRNHFQRSGAAARGATRLRQTPCAIEIYLLPFTGDDEGNFLTFSSDDNLDAIFLRQWRESLLIYKSMPRKWRGPKLVDFEIDGCHAREAACAADD